LKVFITRVINFLLILFFTNAFNSPHFESNFLAGNRMKNGQYHRTSMYSRTSGINTLASSLQMEGAEDISDKQDCNWDLELFSPCKINLFLQILRKREDGYHDLASLFQTVGFGDTLFFKKIEDPEASQDEFECTMPGVPVDNTNLVIQALDLFREKTGLNQYFKVRLEKQVPAQAGLGGGSGNCATALFAANELTGCPATLEDLEIWSAELGSDITFFFSRGTCYCTGRGEILAPMEPLPPTSLYLIKPAKGLSTPLVFKNLDYNELTKEDPLEILKSFDDGIYNANYVNDLEPPAFRVMPELRQMKEELEACNFKVVQMSGSGTTIFALGEPFEDEDVPEGQQFPEGFKKCWDAEVTHALFIARPDDDHLWYKQTVPYGQQPESDPDVVEMDEEITLEGWEEEEIDWAKIDAWDDEDDLDIEELKQMLQDQNDRLQDEEFGEGEEDDGEDGRIGDVEI